MDIQYYESVETGVILKGPRIESVFNDIYGSSTAFYSGTHVPASSWCKWLIRQNRIRKIDPPSVIDFLKKKDKISAVTRYREIHNCALGKAYDMTNKIEKDLKEFSKK